MKKFVTLILMFLGLKMYATLIAVAPPALVMKENKNQWNQQVLYKTETHNGSIFLCKNNFTYLLGDTNDLTRLRHDLHRVYGYKPQLNHTLHLHAFRATFKNANAGCTVSGSNKLNEYYNYYLGKDRSKWASNVGGYYNVNYSGIYDQIDLGVSSVGVDMKYEFEVKKGGHASDIKIAYEGMDGLRIVNEELKIATSIGDITDTKPYAYQVINGETVEVQCLYSLHGNEVSFNFPYGYDTTETLVIDPILIFSTYSGSTADNFGYSATYDSHGNAYVAGTVFQVGQFPITLGAFQTSWAGGVGYGIPGGYDLTGTDIGITKYDSAGHTRLYSTYLGGDGDELPHSLIVNSNDELFVFGTTSSDNFPVTPNAFDTTFKGGPDPGLFGGIAVHYVKGSDLYITRFNQTGTALIASTYVGGSGNDGLTYPEYQGLHYNYADEVRGEINIDVNDNVYIATCTRSTDFPVTTGAYQTSNAGGTDGVIIKMNSDLSKMIWGTYLGGSADDAIYSVAFDANNDLYVAGGTESLDLPVSANALEKTYNGGRCDGFVAHLSQNGNVLMQCSYYGSPDYDQTYFVRTSKAGNVYLLGQVDSSGSLFIHNAVYNKVNGGEYISELSPTLDSLIMSTSFGAGLSKPDISPTAFLVDVCSKMYVSGWGSNFSVIEAGAPDLSTNNLDVTANAYQPTTDGQDFYVMVLEDDASALNYATYFGSHNNEEHVDGGTSRFDKKGIVYQAVCAGCGGLSSFPTTAGAVSRTNNSENCNNAVFKLDLQLPIVVAAFSAPPTGCAPYTVSFTNSSKIVQSPTYNWTFGDGDTSTVLSPTHTYTRSGLYTIQLVVTDPASCNISDTLSKQILIIANNATDTLPPVTICSSQSVQIGVLSAPDSNVTYLWSPSNTLSENNVSNPFATPQQTTTYQLLISNGICTDTVHQTVVIFKDALILQGNNISCPGDTVQLTVTTSQPGQQLTYSWQPTSQIISGATTATPLVSPSQSTTYVITVSNQIHCTLTDSIQINVLSTNVNISAKATPDTIMYGDTTQLSATLSPNVVSYSWLPDSTLSAINILNPLAYPKETHTYYVQAQNSNGCVKTDSVTVYLLLAPCKQSNLYIPDAFSPNGDGKNDVLYVRGNYISNFHFAIYDRWGQKVFDTRDITRGWDGTFNGKRLDPAVFGYYVDGVCEGGGKFMVKGNVTLLR